MQLLQLVCIFFLFEEHTVLSANMFRGMVPWIEFFGFEAKITQGIKM